MRRAAIAVGLFLMLGGCPAPEVTNNMAVPTPTPTASPTPWLSVDPICTGAITRAEWLVCDNAQLNALHRRLGIDAEHIGALLLNWRGAPSANANARRL